MSLQHQQELKAQRDVTANLKDQLVLAGLQHAGALKEAIAAGDAKVEEAQKQFADAQEELRRELEEERKLREMERDRNVVLAVAQVSLGQMIKDTDAKALSRCSCPLLISFIFLSVYSQAGFF
jgi:molybdopterin converting factor small subunit